MKNGRNDSCPCGSGRKYKKCCLQKDQVAEAAKSDQPESERFGLKETKPKPATSGISQPRPEPRRSAPAPPPDPRMEAINARWTEFNAATEAERAGIFVRTLDEPAVMDDDMAFEMLNQLYSSAVNSGERDRWDGLADQLRERFPEVYAASSVYYRHWSILNAVASRRPERVRELALEIATTAGDDVDQFVRMMDMLAWHGYCGTLGEAMHIAWPLIRDSPDVLWGRDKFSSCGADCIVFERLERNSKLDGRDPELVEQVKYYGEDLQLNHFAEYIRYLSGQKQRTWVLSDFEEPTQRRGRRREPDPDDDRPSQTDSTDHHAALAYLLDEFVNYARHQEGVPWTKAALARKNLRSYILDRREGKLEERASMMESIMNPKRKSRRKPRVPDHPVCPDLETLDRYFASLLHFMNPQLYDVAGTFVLIPAWLRFLESRGLLDADHSQEILTDMRQLHADLLPLFEFHRNDPSLAEAMQQWNPTTEQPTAKGNGHT